MIVRLCLSVKLKWPEVTLCLSFISLLSPHDADINECTDKNMTACSQICINSVGSYRCECEKGYFLEEDGKTCTKGERGEIDIFSSAKVTSQLDVPLNKETDILSLFKGTSDCDVKLTACYWCMWAREGGGGRGGVLQNTDTWESLDIFDPCACQNGSVSSTCCCPFDSWSFLICWVYLKKAQML